MSNGNKMRRQEGLLYTALSNLHENELTEWEMTLQCKKCPSLAAPIHTVKVIPLYLYEFDEIKRNCAFSLFLLSNYDLISCERTVYRGYSGLNGPFLPTAICWTSIEFRAYITPIYYYSHQHTHVGCNKLDHVWLQLLICPSILVNIQEQQTPRLSYRNPFWSITKTLVMRHQGVRSACSKIVTCYLAFITRGRIL